MNLPTTVAPFILRGVTLRGIDCVYQPIQPRLDAYALLAKHLTNEQVCLDFNSFANFHFSWISLVRMKLLDWKPFQNSELKCWLEIFPDDM